MRFFRFMGKVLYALLLIAICGASAWFSFRYFLQGKPISVPDLKGFDVDSARRLAADKGLDLVVEPDLAAYDSEVPVERIWRQRPAAGSAVKQGATIRVALSLGPRILLVPDLTGLTARTASVRLERVGLVLGSVTNLSLPGLTGVVSQDPLAGEKVSPGLRVSVLVGREPPSVRRILPDFVGRDLERARADLEAFGYRLGSVHEEAYEGVPEGRILRQFPLAGYPVPAGFAVAFAVSRGSGATP